MRPRYRGDVQQTSRGLFGATEVHHPAGRSVWRTAKDNKCRVADRGAYPARFLIVAGSPENP